jgi:glyoxylase-like metal-dependent hydrolase (beta-lactamase superfamily II)
MMTELPRVPEIPQMPEGMHVFERGWLSSNNILFAGDAPALVDSGYATHRAQTLALVDGVLNGQPLARLFNTHLHSDHCGGNAALQARYPAMQTWIPPGQAPFVTNWDPVALTYVPTGQTCSPFRFDDTLRPGSTLTLGADAWEVHAAPGHDPDSVILFQPDYRMLLSADALWEKGFGVVFPELDGIGAFDEVAATLDLIEHLNPLTVVPGHGRVFMGIQEPLRHARARLQGFVQDPPKHALHAAKVMLKFKLLEYQRLSTDELLTWFGQASFMQSIHREYFSQTDSKAWGKHVLAGLVASKAARIENDDVVNA